MNEKSLEKNLANIERELVALQTAHDIGLGAVGFYVYTGNFTTALIGEIQAAMLLIDVVDGERTDPLVDVYLSSIYNDDSVGFGYAERVSERKFDWFIMRVFYSEPVQMWYKVISSSRLTVRVTTDYQEYLDWLDE